MERTAAILMAKFEAMWKVFVENRGSFEPFMDLYLDRWLHSYVPHSPVLVRRMVTLPLGINGLR